jgi:translation initiation factor 2 subunit 1
MELEVGDTVLCTVDRIVGTVVFVKIEGNGEGSIVISEIAPGRIRNLRAYVVPKKKIVCKVLRISQNGHIDLSLRRVTQKEKKEVIEQTKQEKSYTNLLKSISKEDSDRIIKEILKETTIYEFLQEAKENPTKLEKIVGKINAKKILEILKTEKQKKAIIKREISLSTTKPNGLELIKDILGNINDAEIKYISAGRYTIKTEAENLKIADNKLKEIIKDIEKKTKQQNIDFNIKEK